MIALYIAFQMGLDDPKWAAMTVWIVAQGSRGMSLSKSQYRLAGTAIGAVVAITLTAIAVQTPEVFLLLLALWIGICTAVATGLRNFRSYGAVLAGYTAILISMDAVSDPESIFDIAVSRVIYIGLGIMVEAVLAALFAPTDPFAAVTRQLESYLGKVLAMSSAALRRKASGPAVHALFAAAANLDTALEYATASSGSVRRKLGYFRTAIVASLEVLAIARAAQDSLNSDNGDESFVVQTAALLEMASRQSDAVSSQLDNLRSAIDASKARELEMGFDHFTDKALLFDRLTSLLTALGETIEAQSNIHHAKAPLSHPQLSFHIDRLAAIHNGLRAVVAVLAASWVWIMTAWPSGAGFVTITGVVCALFATRPSAVNGGIGFLKGTLCAVLAAGICNFAVIPATSGFLLLALAMALFMIPAGIAMRNTATAGPAAGFAIFFWDLVSPDNLTRVDAASFFNGALALVLGIGCGTLIFALLFPADLRAARDRMYRALKRDLFNIGLHPHRFSKRAWVTRTADRLGRLMASSKIVPEMQAESDLRCGLAMLQLGKSVISLSQLSVQDADARAEIKAVMSSLGRHDGDVLLQHSRTASSYLLKASAHAEGEERRALLRAAFLTHQIGIELDGNPTMFGA